MSWFRKSVGLVTLPGAHVPLAPSLAQVLNGLQAEMLALLAPLAGSHADVVRRRILAAADVAGLWFLRSELALVLGAHIGEAQAIERVQGLAELFEQHLPRGLRPRRRGF